MKLRRNQNKQMEINIGVMQVGLQYSCDRNIYKCNENFRDRIFIEKSFGITFVFYIP